MENSEGAIVQTIVKQRRLPIEISKLQLLDNVHIAHCKAGNWKQNWQSNAMGESDEHHIHH